MSALKQNSTNECSRTKESTVWETVTSRKDLFIVHGENTVELTKHSFDYLKKNPSATLSLQKQLFKVLIGDQ